MTKIKHHPSLWDGVKPAYKIPTVKSIRRREGRNGLVVASLFAGGGGSSTGYRWAGYSVPYVNEFLPAAQETYRANWPNTHIDPRDVRDVTGQDILEVCGPVDLLDGSPPCKAFSTAGQRDKNWGKVYEYADGVAQSNDDLVFEYTRLVNEVQPRMFVMENVKGLTMGVARGYFREVFHLLEQAGYRVQAKLLDAQWLGVPQRRVRVFIQGVRNDLEGNPTWPTPLPYRYSIADALGYVGELEYANGGHNQANDPAEDLENPVRTITADGGQSNHLKVKNGGYGNRTHQLNEVAPAILATGGSGGNQKIRLHTTPAPMARKKRGSLGGGVPNETQNEPARTITAGDMGVVNQTEIRISYDSGYHDGHITRGNQPADTINAAGMRGSGPNQYKVQEGPVSLGYTDGFAKKRKIADTNPADTIVAGGSPSGSLVLREQTTERKLLISEVKALCGFPPDYELTGSYAQQWYRLGESVPPPMAKAVGEAAAGVLLKMP